MTTALTVYSSARLITLTLNSLAGSTGLVTGRESTVINSTDLNYVDYMVGGLLTASSTGTAASRQIEIWSYGAYDGTGTAFSGGATGADAALTLTTKSLLKLVTIIPMTSASSTQYVWGPFSIANAYGGTVPQEWGLFVTHNASTSLAASTHSSWYYTVHVPVTYQSCA